MTERLRQQLLDTARGRIVALLRGGALTAEDLAARLGLTRSAVRLQISALERDGVVRRAGLRSGPTRPSALFELTTAVEVLLSKAYLPLLTHLVEVLGEALAPEQTEDLLRQTGKRIAAEWAAGLQLPSDAPSRVVTASTVMNAQLGALTHVESDTVIRGDGCPLAALTGKYNGVCLAVESLLTEFLGMRVRECCDREGRPRCCFVVGRS
jgi:predicted ArsR family transcriptional regulator